MQMRCSNCHRPYAIGKNEIYAALDMMAAENLAHYNSACPHCRRVNRVSRDELHRAAPDWQEPAQDEQADIAGE